MSIGIKVSFTHWALLHVTEMRNLELDPENTRITIDTENTCTTIAKRFTAGVVYAILPLVGIVEAVVRGILVIPAGVGVCCSKIVSQNQYYGCVGEFLDMTGGGAVASGMAGCMSVAGFFLNFTKDRIRETDLENVAFACCPRGSQSSERDI